MFTLKRAIDIVSVQFPSTNAAISTADSKYELAQTHGHTLHLKSGHTLHLPINILT